MIGTRVHITAILPSGKIVIGTVLVNSDPECTIEHILLSAAQWVNEGGWQSGGRDTGPAVAQVATAWQTVEGGFDNPGLMLNCGEI